MHHGKKNHKQLTYKANDDIRSTNSNPTTIMIVYYCYISPREVGARGGPAMTTNRQKVFFLLLNLQPNGSSLRSYCMHRYV
mmetsp:Transcript_33302/g.54351  ORF Transcript_33302/g.54351 Transcript_33302/m.54351 type:complete len:81 (+) Transcript_33302:211-453(+)